MFTKKQITIATIITVLVTVALIALTLVLATHFEDTSSFNEAQWAINPVNPASPLHSVLF